MWSLQSNFLDRCKFGLEFDVTQNIQKKRLRSLKQLVISPEHQAFFFSKKMDKMFLLGWIRIISLHVFSSLHRGSSSICWVLVRDLAIDMHFFGCHRLPMVEIYFLWWSLNMTSTCLEHKNQDSIVKILIFWIWDFALRVKSWNRV